MYIYRLTLLVIVCFAWGVRGADVESQNPQQCCICFMPLSEDGAIPLATVKKPNRLSMFLRGISPVSEPQFACCHGGEFHKSCVEAWVDREHYNCPVCRTTFKWSLSRIITFLESEDNKEGIEYASRAFVGISGFLASTIALDKAGLKSEYITSALVLGLIAWTLFSLVMTVRNSNSSVGWDGLRSIY